MREGHASLPCDAAIRFPGACETPRGSRSLTSHPVVRVHGRHDEDEGEEGHVGHCKWGEGGAGRGRSVARKVRAKIESEVERAQSHDCGSPSRATDPGSSTSDGDARPRQVRTCPSRTGHSGRRGAGSTRNGGAARERRPHPRKNGRRVGRHPQKQARDHLINAPERRFPLRISVGSPSPMPKKDSLTMVACGLWEVKVDLTIFSLTFPQHPLRAQINRHNASATPSHHTTLLRVHRLVPVPGVRTARLIFHRSNLDPGLTLCSAAPNMPHR